MAVIAMSTERIDRFILSPCGGDQRFVAVRKRPVCDAGLGSVKQVACTRAREHATIAMPDGGRAQLE
jgi:hypothetical protein